MHLKFVNNGLVAEYSVPEEFQSIKVKQDTLSEIGLNVSTPSFFDFMCDTEDDMFKMWLQERKFVDGILAKRSERDRKSRHNVNDHGCFFMSVGYCLCRATDDLTTLEERAVFSLHDSKNFLNYIVRRSDTTHRIVVERRWNGQLPTFYIEFGTQEWLHDAEMLRFAHLETVVGISGFMEMLQVGKEMRELIRAYFGKDTSVYFEMGGGDLWGKHNARCLAFIGTETEKQEFFELLDDLEFIEKPVVITVSDEDFKNRVDGANFYALFANPFVNHPYGYCLLFWYMFVRNKTAENMWNSADKKYHLQIDAWCLKNWCLNTKAEFDMESEFVDASELPKMVFALVKWQGRNLALTVGGMYELDDLASPKSVRYISFAELIAMFGEMLPVYDASVDASLEDSNLVDSYAEELMNEFKAEFIDDDATLLKDAYEYVLSVTRSIVHTISVNDLFSHMHHEFVKLQMRLIAKCMSKMMHGSECLILIRKLGDDFKHCQRDKYVGGVTITGYADGGGDGLLLSK